LGEENLIAKEKNKLKIPYNLGIIISNQDFNTIIIHLLKLINWSINLGIKEIILYDPFNILSEEKISNFKENLNLFFDKNTKEIYLFKNNKICYMNWINDDYNNNISNNNNFKDSNNNCTNELSKDEIKGIKGIKKDYNKCN